MEGKRINVTPWKYGPDEIVEDMELKGIRNLRAVPRNWKEWRRIVLEEKVHSVVLEKENKKKKKNYLS
jgi:hypothetical protein